MKIDEQEIEIKEQKQKIDELQEKLKREKGKWRQNRRTPTKEQILDIIPEFKMGARTWEQSYTNGLVYFNFIQIQMWNEIIALLKEIRDKEVVIHENKAEKQKPGRKPKKKDS